MYELKFEEAYALKTTEKLTRNLDNLVLIIKQQTLVQYLNKFNVSNSYNIKTTADIIECDKK